MTEKRWFKVELLRRESKVATIEVQATDPKEAYRLAKSTAKDQDYCVVDAEEMLGEIHDLG